MVAGLLLFAAPVVSHAPGSTSSSRRAALGECPRELQRGEWIRGLLQCSERAR
jgi:hypothetical protein